MTRKKLKVLAHKVILKNRLGSAPRHPFMEMVR